MADPLDQYRDPFDAPDEASPWPRPPVNTLAGDQMPPTSATPPARAAGKGSVQQQPPEALGQHNLLSRAFWGLGGALADSYEAMGRLPTTWDEAANQFAMSMPGGGLTGMLGRSRAAVPATTPLAQYGSPAAAGHAPPPPITGHNIGSLQMPRVPRQLDDLGLYSAAEEAAHAYPRTSGTARDIQEWLSSQGVTANEMRARGLTAMFQDPRRSITRQELLGHLSDNPIQLQAARYQGEKPDTDLRILNTHVDDQGMRLHEIEDRHTGRTFTLTEDRDAGNVYVQGERGSFLEVPGRTNNQTFDHGMQAIRGHLEGSPVPTGAAGPARYGPDYDTSYSLNTTGNPTYAEDVLFAPPRLTPAQLRAREAAAAPHRAELDRLNAESLRYGPNRVAAQQELIALQNRIWRDALRVAPDPPRGFVDSHYPDQQNPIGWIRHSMQEGFPVPPQGLRGGMPDTSQPVRGLLWDELQMPMAQRIRDQGARNEARVAELQQRLPRLNEELAAAQQAAHDFFSRNAMASGVARQYRDLQSDLNAAYTDGSTPALRAQALIAGNRLRNAESARDLAQHELDTAERAIVGNPFVNDPHQALRTLMHYGLSNPALREPGVGGIFLTPGALQNERYNLARHVGGLRYNPEVRSLSYTEPPYRGDGNWRALPRATGVTPETLPDYVGADVARQLLAQPLRQGAHELTDLGSLEIGGRGMRENYDRIYPETLDAILRRLDPHYPGRRQVALSSAPYRNISPEAAARLSPELQSRLAAEAREAPSYLSEPVHFFPITDRIRAQLARGLPYFGGIGAIGLGQTADPLDQYSQPMPEPTAP